MGRVLYHSGIEVEVLPLRLEALKIQSQRYHIVQYCNKSYVQAGTARFVCNSSRFLCLQLMKPMHVLAVCQYAVIKLAVLSPHFDSDN